MREAPVAIEKIAVLRATPAVAPGACGREVLLVRPDALLDGEVGAERLGPRRRDERRTVARGVGLLRGVASSCPSPGGLVGLPLTAGDARDAAGRSSALHCSTGYGQHSFAEEAHPARRA